MTKKIISQSLIAFVIILLILMSFGEYSFADSSGAEISASGIKFKEEKNISMEKEELFISQGKIEVSCVFKNHSDKDIIIEVAFPVPEYDSDDAERGLPFKDFTVTVNGKKRKYSTEVRALVQRKDYSNVLKQMGISIHDFGGSKYPHYKKFYPSLSRKDKKILLQAGLVNSAEIALWTVSIKHHWTQKFPANSSIEISHTYTPWWGYSLVDGSDIKNKQSYLYKDACISEATSHWMAQTLTDERPISVTIIGYILVTAKNWRTPIKNFHLVIEKDAIEKLGVCFDHKVVKKSDTQYESQIENFIPKQNLKVYLFR